MWCIPHIPFFSANEFICIYSKRTKYCSIIAFVSNDGPNECLPQQPNLPHYKGIVAQLPKRKKSPGLDAQLKIKIRQWVFFYIVERIFLFHIRSLEFIVFACSWSCTAEVFQTGCSDSSPSKKKKMLSQQEMSEPIAMETVLKSLEHRFSLLPHPIRF